MRFFGRFAVELAGLAARVCMCVPRSSFQQQQRAALSFLRAHGELAGFPEVRALVTVTDVFV